MEIAQTFRDLKVYQAAHRVAQAIFELSRRFPAEERFSLTDQIRRSSRAVGAMLAEAWARRRYRPAFIDKINQALGETMETQAWLDHALSCRYLQAEDFSRLDAELQHVGAMLARMIARAEDFSKNAPPNARLREDEAWYGGADW